MIVGIGIVASRYDTEGGAEQWMLAGRRLPLAVGLCTMTATWVGGGYINGTAEAVFDPARGLLWTQAPWGYALSLIVGGLFFAGVMRRAGYRTLLDPFDARYGPSVAAWLYLPALVGELFWSSAILVALGTTCGVLIDMDPRIAIVVSAFVAVVYTWLGGLRSVAWTDVAQLAMMVVGLGIAVPYAIEAAGGWGAVSSSYGAQFGATARLAPPLSDFVGPGALASGSWLWADYALLLILGGVPWGVYFQRVLACKDAASARRMSLAAAVGCLVMAVPAILLGASAATVDWSSLSASPPANPSLALPHALNVLTPPWVAALGLAAVAAAVMSSVDSSILSAASMFAWNVYARLLRPGAGDREVKRALRVAVAVVGAAAAGLALQVGSVYALWALCADLVYVVLFPQLVAALWDRRATARGALAGAAVGLFLRVGGGEPLLGWSAWLPYPGTAADGSVLFPFRTTAMLAGMLTIWGVSRVDRAFAGEAQEEPRAARAAK